MVASPHLGEPAALAALARSCRQLQVAGPTAPAQARMRARFWAAVDRDRRALPFLYGRPRWTQRLAAGVLAVSLTGGSIGYANGYSPGEMLDSSSHFIRSLVVNLGPADSPGPNAGAGDANTGPTNASGAPDSLLQPGDVGGEGTPSPGSASQAGGAMAAGAPPGTPTPTPTATPRLQNPTPTVTVPPGTPKPGGSGPLATPSPQPSAGDPGPLNPTPTGSPTAAAPTPTSTPTPTATPSPKPTATPGGDDDEEPEEEGSEHEEHEE